MLNISLRAWIINQRCFGIANINCKCLSTQKQNYIQNITLVNSKRVAFIVKLLDINYIAAKNILVNCPVLNRLAQNRIEKAHSLCLQHGMNNMLITTTPNVLILSPYILEQRFLYYKELGCTRITPHMTVSFWCSISSTIREFKNRQIIPPETDVIKTMLSHLHEPPLDLDVLNSLNDDYSISSARTICLRHYLKKRFNFTEESLDLMFKHKPLLSSKPLTPIKEVLDFLEKELKFPMKRITKRPYLLNTSITDIRTVTKELKDIGCIDFRKLISRSPLSITMKLDSIKEKLDTIAKFDVPIALVAKYPEILILSNQTIEQRFKEFETIPELRGHRAHPRVLNLIFLLHRVKQRLKILKKLHINCTSLNVLCTDEAKFKKFTQDGGKDSTKGKDIISFFNREFGGNKEIKSMIRRHPLWCQIPFMNAYETFCYLKERNYSHEDISKNIQIVLYSRSQIEQELDKIDSDIRYWSLDLTSSQKLAMCLYNIEKLFHFNGYGALNFRQEQDIILENDIKKNLQSLRHTSKL